jgi:hypothetical protein
MDDARRIDDRDGVLEWARGEWLKMSHPTIDEIPWQAYCPKCGADRRVTPSLTHYPPEIAVPVLPPRTRGVHVRPPGEPSPVRLEPLILPWLFEATCPQCETRFVGLLYQGAAGTSYAFFSSAAGGVASAHTPRAVGYYLDQAHRATSAGAYSAAVAMYRAALEQFLFAQGFTKGMLAEKLGALKAAITDGNAPRWATDLDDAFLKVLKDLGNGAIHPNGGDITKQDALDASLVRLVRETFVELLELAYELPARKAERLTNLQTAAAQMK